MDGVIPFSKTFDTLGFMAKTVIDLAQVIQVVEDGSGLHRSRHRIKNPLTATWSGLKIGVLNPEEWKWSTDLAKPNPQVEHQLVIRHCQSGTQD